MRINNLFALPMLLLVFCVVDRSLAQIPDDIVALAAIRSNDYYYQSNVPFSMRVSDSLQSRIDQIRTSVELDLEDAAGELGAARKMLFQLDAARFAIECGNPIRDAITELNERWENQPEVLDDFDVERFRNDFGKARQNYGLADIEEMGDEPRQFINESWDKFAMPFLNKMKVEPLEAPIRLQFGLVQNVGFGLLTNTTQENFKNSVVVINYEVSTGSETRSEPLVYFFPELGAGKSVAIFSFPKFEGLSTAEEKSQRKFNDPIKNGELSLSLDFYSENGKCMGIKPEIKDGLRTQMDCLRLVLVQDAVFGSTSGERLVIRKTAGSGRTLKVFFVEKGKASINNAWNTEDRDEVFEPQSTAFRFRIADEDDSDDRELEKDDVPRPRGEHGKEVEIGVPYTWRAGSLIKESAFKRGGQILYPVVE